MTSPVRLPSLMLALAVAAAGCTGSPARPAGGGDQERVVKRTPGPTGTAGAAEDRALATNLGGFQGVLKVPVAGLVANHGASLLANHGSGMIGNNGAALISDAAAGYRLQGVGQLTAGIGGVVVRLVDERGEMVAEPVTTQADGSFVVARVQASGRLVFLQAELPREGQTIRLAATAPAPRAAGLIKVQLDPATTLVTKKVREMIWLNAFHPAALKPAAVQLVANALAARMSEQAVVAAVVLPDDGAARAFDASLAASAALAAAAGQAIGQTGSADLAARTPDKALPPPPPPPEPTLAPAAATPAPGEPAPAGPAPTAAPTTEPFPEPSQEPVGVATPTPEPPAGPLPTPAVTPTPVPTPSDRPGATPTPVPTAGPTNHPTASPTAAPANTLPLAATIAGKGNLGNDDGPGATASFKQPNGLLLDAAGTRLYVADEDGHRIRAIALDDPLFTVSTFAGLTGNAGSTDGPLATARLSSPSGLIFGPGAALLVVDSGNSRIRRVADGQLTTLVGTNGNGFEEGDAATARYRNPRGMVADGAGGYFVADTLNHRIRRFDAAGVTSTFAGSDQSGLIDGPPGLGRLSEPAAIARDPASGVLFVAQRRNAAVRQVAPDGTLSTLAGTGSSGHVDGEGAIARFNDPNGIVREATGSLLVADTGNHVIRRVSPAGVVTTVIGTGDGGYLDAADYRLCKLRQPRGLALDAQGNLYVSDEGNNRIRRFRAGF